MLRNRFWKLLFRNVSMKRRVPKSFVVVYASPRREARPVMIPPVVFVVRIIYAAVSSLSSS